MSMALRVVQNDTTHTMCAYLIANGCVFVCGRVGVSVCDWWKSNEGDILCNAVYRQMTLQIVLERYRRALMPINPPDKIDLASEHIPTTDHGDGGGWWCRYPDISGDLNVQAFCDGSSINLISTPESKCKCKPSAVNKKSTENSTTQCSKSEARKVPWTSIAKSFYNAHYQDHP